MNSELFIEFLKRLMHNAANPIFLIVDGHPTHKSTKVKKYVVSTQGKLKLFYLPPYSPELNPDEFVWNYVKNHHMGKKEIKGPDDFKQKLLSCLKSLQRCTNKIMGFFHAPDVKYASC
jgi:transposase